MEPTHRPDVFESLGELLCLYWHGVNESESRRLELLDFEDDTSCLLSVMKVVLW